MKTKMQAVLLSLGLIFLSFGLLINVVTSMFEPSFNAFFGQGEKIIVPVDNSENWDTNYYTQETKSESEIKLRNDEFVKEVVGEGIVLLKNEDLLPLSKQATIAPFGYGYKAPSYVGKGSGTTKFNSPFTPKDALEKHFIVNTDVEEITLNDANINELEEKNGTSNDSAYGVDNRIKEIKASAYETLDTASLKNSHGVVFIARQSAENIDIKIDEYVDGTKHRLSLTRNELETIRFSNKFCESTTVVLNVPAHFEIQPMMSDSNYKVDALVHISYPGSIGFSALSDVLCGEINPSGRTVDTYTTNLLSSPAMQNFGAHFYKNQQTIPFIEYEEGIYVGYKYYESIYEESLADSTINFDYESVVQAPFGYGLSYTDFSQKILKYELNEDSLSIEVEVENIGETPGKDTILLFYGAPYTSFDKANKIEKSAKNLLDFSKTPIIEPKETFVQKFEIPLSDMASYFANYFVNDEKVGSYILQKGEYKIYLSMNSHDVYEEICFDIDETIYYLNEDNNSDVEETSIASNKFNFLTNYMLEEGVTNLSRNNFVNTYPEKAKNFNRNLNEEYLEKTKSFEGFNVNTHPQLGNISTSEVYTEKEHHFLKNDLTLSSLRGVDFYDPLWDELLENINFDDESAYNELRDLFIFAGFSTGKLSSINKPSTHDFDGPSGFNDAYNIFKETFYCYPSEVVVASTYNENLVKKLGEYIGEEALLNNISGWYAPGLNIHRTPFGGRNFEYYSEDALLSGYIAKAVVEGVSTKGVYPYLKHFILNEQESYRSSIRVWVNEQALREIYLKPFEIVVKESKTNLKYTKDDSGELGTKEINTPLAVMSAFNYVGPYQSSCCKALLTDLLRNERGFKGFVISDCEVDGSHDARIRSGNDLYLWSSNRIEVKEDLTKYIKDISTTTGQNALINSIKAVSYVVANSNALNKVAPGFVSYYKTPLRKIILNYTFEYSFYVIGSLLLCLFIVLMINQAKIDKEKVESIHD